MSGVQLSMRKVAQHGLSPTGCFLLNNLDLRKQKSYKLQAHILSGSLTQ